MKDDERNSNQDPNSWWDSVEPECRWIPQCHRLLEPGGCDTCDFMNPDLPRNEDGEPYTIPDCPEVPDTQSAVPKPDETRSPGTLPICRLRCGDSGRRLCGT